MVRSRSLVNLTDLTKIKEAITAVLPNVEFIEDDITTIPQSWTTLEGEQMELFERLMNLLDDCDDVGHRLS